MSSNRKSSRLFHIGNLLLTSIDSTLTCWFVWLTNGLGWSWVANKLIRPRLFRLFGFDIGQNTCIMPCIRIYSRRDRVRIGNEVFVNQNCFFDAAAPVTIGNYCQIGFNVSFVTSSHDLEARLGQLRPFNAKPIVLEDYVWIGSHVVILQGVRIGQGSVVAAGSIVTKDVPPNTVVAGVPAKSIRNLQNVLETQSAPNPSAICSDG